jgi:dTDP-4-amino-4,6-dideoxygalactose transaminase
MKYKYNSWPLGRLKKEHQRPEPDLLKERGYQWNDPRDIVDMCEEKIAKFFGAKYCVTTDCCSHAIFLSLQYLLFKGELNPADDIVIPRHTYVSAPIQVLHAGLHVRFKDIEWQGCYALNPTRVIDAAVLWERDSYVDGSLMCLSFQIKKAIPTGKMGAILTNDEDAAKWLKWASYDGRDLTTPYDSVGHVKMLGWHMYATPEDCARTILLMDDLPEDRGAYMGNENYPDVSQMIYGL